MTINISYIHVAACSLMLTFQKKKKHYLLFILQILLKSLYCYTILATIFSLIIYNVPPILKSFLKGQKYTLTPSTTSAFSDSTSVTRDWSMLDSGCALTGRVGMTLATGIDPGMDGDIGLFFL